MNLITLTTDFGARDWYVGTMKGVILGINPRTAIVDLCHEIAPGDVRAGAFTLSAACRYFPPGTVHVAVVDPGVGSRRRAIAVRTDRAFFVGPDNGVLALALASERVRQIRCLKHPEFFLDPVSGTFHGRDVFAPVAAHLSNGVPVEKFGPSRRTFVRPNWPSPSRSRGMLRGEIVHLDRFGNAITNVPASLLAGPELAGARVMAGGQDLGPVRRFYAEVRVGQPLALIGSAGLLEISVHRGNASEQLGLSVGDPVRVLPDAVASPPRRREPVGSNIPQPRP